MRWRSDVDPGYLVATIILIVGAAAALSVDVVLGLEEGAPLVGAGEENGPLFMPGAYTGGTCEIAKGWKNWCTRQDSNL